MAERFPKSADFYQRLENVKKNPTIYYKIKDRESSIIVNGSLLYDEDGLFDFEIEDVASQIAQKEYYEDGTGYFDEVSIFILRAVGDKEISVNKTVEVTVEFEEPQFYPEILDND